MRKLTLTEVTLLGAYTCTRADRREIVRRLEKGVFDDLDQVEERPLKRWRTRVQRCSSR